MTDLSRRPARPAGWSGALVAVCSLLLAGSLALPWAREVSEQEHVGAAVLFAGHEYPRLGLLLVPLWLVTVVLTAGRPGRAAPLVAALAVCAVCPAACARAITGSKGLAIGQDAAGRTTEWELTSTLEPGYYLASVAAVGLLTAVLLRARASRAAGQVAGGPVES